MTPLPPSRYRIEERGRRLIVIDQWAGNVEVTASLPSQPAPPPTRTEVKAPTSSATVVAKAAAAAARSSAPASRPGQASASVSLPGNALTRALFKLQPAGQGGAILTTTKVYDLSGPRQVALTRDQVAKLDGLAMAIVIALVIVLVFGMAGDWILLLVPVFVLLRFQGAIRKRTTAAIDKLV